MNGMEGFQHAMREIKRLRELMKMLNDLKALKRTLDLCRGAEQRQEILRQFAEEQKDNFWRAAKDDKALESLREQCGYDEEAWSLIVAELKK